MPELPQPKRQGYLTDDGIHRCGDKSITFHFDDDVDGSPMWNSGSRCITYRQRSLHRVALLFDWYRARGYFP